LYVFAEDLDVAERIIEATESGDTAINDCAIHPLIPELPFGGVGNSGMGKYHGRWGFEAFTNARGVMYHNTRMRYPPCSRHTDMAWARHHRQPDLGQAALHGRHALLVALAFGLASLQMADAGERAGSERRWQ
jgi:hypothetical protein